MASTLQALLCFLAIGGGATAWIYGVRLRREEAQAGIMTFAGMHWREFQRLIVAALERRGCRRVRLGEPGDDDGNVDLECEGQPWLLSTKHGAGYVVTDHAINTFADALALRGAAGGWMTTLGEASADARELARRNKIELLDGRRLWSEIRPLLDASQIASIAGASRKRASRQLAIAWGVAAIVGLLVLLLGGRGAAEDQASITPVAQPPAEPTRAAPPAGPDATAPALPTGEASAPAGPVPTDPVALADRRRKVIAAVGTLPWVDRAAWSTQSTLTVYQLGDAVDTDSVCSILLRYDELSSSRLQLQPPQASTQAVRFLQCRSY